MDTWDEWDETGEPIKRANIVRRTFNRVCGKARKIRDYVHFFFEKLRINEKYYTQLLQDANMWHLISGAIGYHVETDTFDAKDGRGVTLMSFDKKRDYTLEIDAVKIRNMFFKTDLPVKIEIKEEEVKSEAAEPPTTTDRDSSLYWRPGQENW